VINQNQIHCKTVWAGNEVPRKHVKACEKIVNRMVKDSDIEDVIITDKSATILVHSASLARKVQEAIKADPLANYCYDDTNFEE
jgi:hypothetical protein